MVHVDSEVQELDYRGISQTSFNEYLNILSKHLQNNYGIVVKEKSIVDSKQYIGSYDGETIVIKDSLSSEHKLFLLAHLFGHLIQWCKSDLVEYIDIEKILNTNSIKGLSQSEIQLLRKYEYEASGYAIYLLSEVVVTDLFQWFSDWSHADWEYFSNISNLCDLPNEVMKIEFGTNLIPPKKFSDVEIRKIATKYVY